MGSRVYVSTGGELKPMEPKEFPSEGDLQLLVDRHPEMLADERITSGSDWITVKREMGIPGGDEGGDRWRVDHLLIDTEAIPTFVEVKRSSDARARREVVGQMLDYVAKVATQWRQVDLRTEFERTCNSRGEDAAERLGRFLETSEQYDEADPFWDAVGANLAAERIRMLFVADHIRDELRRIIEFLGRQMQRAAVFGIEIRQFADGSGHVLVPDVVGGSTDSRTAKRDRPQTVNEFLDHISSTQSAEAYQGAEAMIQAARERGYELNEGSLQGGSITVQARSGDSAKTFPVFRLLLNGRIRIPLVAARRRSPFKDDPEVTREWLTRLERIEGVNIKNFEQRVHKGAPTIPMEAFTSADAIEQLMGISDWAFQQIASEAQD